MYSQCDTYIFRVPSDMLHTAKLTAERFAEGYDRHGDSYYEDTTTDELKGVFKKIDEQVFSLVKTFSTQFLKIK